MPLDFSPLQTIDPTGAFYRGQEAARAEQERNMLRAAQMEQMQYQRENMLAQRAEREALAAERRRATEAQNALANYVALGLPEGEEGLYRFGKPGIEMAEARRKAEAAKLEQETRLIEYVSRRLASATPQTYDAIRTEIGQRSPKFAAALPQQFDQEQVLALARQGLSLKEQLEAQMPKDVVVAPGASIFRGGKMIATAPATPAKPTPGETEELVTRLQDPTLTPAARQRLEARLDILTKREPKEPREPAIRTTKVELADGSIGVMNLDTGEITPATVGGQTAKGKPSAFAEKTAGQRKQLAVDLDRTIIELESAAKPKGLIEQSTGSGAGRLVDIGAAFVGQATPGAIAAGKLAPIADMVLKMVPRFEGPQSDKDTKSYKEAAGQLADTSLPTKIRQAAATEIVRLMKARKGQFATQDMATESVGAAPAGAPKRREIAPGVFVTERP